MESSVPVKGFNGHFVPRKHFTREKEKPFRSKSHLEFLAHYDAELVQSDGPIMVVRRKTGTELPLEQKAKTEMMKLLLEEFGTVDGANKAVGNYKASHS
jgi:hypothetical protein